MVVPLVPDVLCTTCLDGGCAFCLTGWPALVNECPCHPTSEWPGPPCPRCGNATVITTVHAPRKLSTRAWSCVDNHCRFETVARIPQPSS